MDLKILQRSIQLNWFIIIIIIINIIIIIIIIIITVLFLRWICNSCRHVIMRVACVLLSESFHRMGTGNNIITSFHVTTKFPKHHYGNSMGTLLLKRF